MKRVLKILLCVLLCAGLILGWLLYKNWNTVLGVADGFLYSQEDVEQKLDNNQKELQKFLDENEKVVVRDLTEEEKKAIEKGDITEDEAVKLITGQKTLEEFLKEKEVSENNEEGQKTPQEEKPETSKLTDQIVSELIAKLYVEKNAAISKLDGLEAKLKAEYGSLSAKEKVAIRATLISKYMPMVLAWEKEADNAVYETLNKIKSELVKAKRDTSVVNKIDEAYKNEKRLKKAYYVKRYMS